MVSPVGDNLKSSEAQVKNEEINTKSKDFLFLFLINFSLNFSLALMSYLIHSTINNYFPLFYVTNKIVHPLSFFVK